MRYGSNTGQIYRMHNTNTALKPIIAVGPMSRKGYFPTELCSDRISFLGLLVIVSPIDSVVLCSIWRRLVWGVLLYGCRRSVGRSVLRAFPASNAYFTRDEPVSKRVGDVVLGRNSPKRRSWRCTQPRSAKAAASVAVVGNMSSIPPAAAVV